MKQILLTKGKVALVDDEDFEWLNQWKWYHVYLGRNKSHEYAVRTDENHSTVLMHREITKAKKGEIPDHIDGDGLNNMRSNLRLGTQSQNMANRISKRGSSRFKGVCWHKVINKWSVSIGFRGKRISLGYFNIESDAAKAYDQKATELFGEFALPNFS